MARRADAVELPHDGLILLVGPSGAGKSTWAASRFRASEILEADAFREMVAGDAADQGATRDAFRLLHGVARARCGRRLRTVVDATNLTGGARRSLLRIAREADVPAVAVVFDVSLPWSLANNAARASRRVPEAVVVRQHEQSRRVAQTLPREGFAAVIWLGEDDIGAS